MRPTRRAFLHGSLAAVACGGPEVRDPPAPVDTAGPDPFAGGTLLGVLPFVDEPERELEQQTGDGLDARYVLDLSTLDESLLVVPTERFFLRTEAPLDLDTAAWTVRLTGLVDAERTLDLAELLARAVPQGERHVECSGNTDYGGFGLQSAASFDGVPLSWVLAQVTPAPGALGVRIVGRDEHPASSGSTAGAAWVFRFDELADAFLATAMNGAPLTPDHGAPVRLVVPGWYGCAMIKWVEEIAWVGADEPATSQMQEFAARTMQSGVPDLARDYAPAEIDPAAVPVRVERWRVDGVDRYRVVGIVWGGREPVVPRIHFDDEDGGLVTLTAPRPDARTWGLWSAVWEPRRSGKVGIWLTVDDDDVRTRRLDTLYYQRFVVVP